MSKRIGNVVILEAEPKMICFECGKVAETRPYGEKGVEICYQCGEKHPERTEHNMGIKLFGKSGDLW